VSAVDLTSGNLASVSSYSGIVSSRGRLWDADHPTLDGVDYRYRGDSLQAWTRHVLGGQPGPRAIRVGFQQVRGPRADCLARHRDLPREPGPECPVTGQVRVHHLHRGLPTVLGLSEVDDAHTSGTKPPQQPERAQLGWIISPQRVHRPPAINRPQNSAIMHR
jgi:hypothetical protein